MNKWDRRFLLLAKYISGWSKDPSTKVGAVIAKGNRVVAMGYNGFPMGVSDLEESLENRDEKYEKIIHAEINAILYSKIDLTGCRLYVFPLPPCSRCAAVIIQSGIKEVHFMYDDESAMERWRKSFELSHSMFSEAGVLVYGYSNDWVNCYENEKE